MTIVVGYVTGAPGEAAVEQALVEARRTGARLVVVNGTRGDAYVDTRFSQGADVDRLRSHLEASGVQHEVRQPLGPDVADLILDAAEEVGADLIVVGLRRRTPVGKLILGSTAQRVLLDAACPVLAVKP
ncbi:universal stress protein [Luteipulveratus flavus]|uniref:Universal stress protein n=1 Tax=Luteipulveratus flavus TaxID=3031728 RepID=A0ABT6C775_9MICO|nr:universal stress protein [Luteipulveratus sp. YIM 133296]MDF8264799.1 universal stress protein [Luteipulveratus sp. YIM 133296]